MSERDPAFPCAPAAILPKADAFACACAAAISSLAGKDCYLTGNQFTCGGEGLQLDFKPGTYSNIDLAVADGGLHCASHPPMRFLQQRNIDPTSASDCISSSVVVGQACPSMGAVSGATCSVECAAGYPYKTGTLICDNGEWGGSIVCSATPPCSLPETSNVVASFGVGSFHGALNGIVGDGCSVYSSTGTVCAVTCQGADATTGDHYFGAGSLECTAVGGAVAQWAPVTGDTPSCMTGDTVYPAPAIVSMVLAGLSRVIITWSANPDGVQRSALELYEFCDNIADGSCTDATAGSLISCPAFLGFEPPTDGITCSRSSAASTAECAATELRVGLDNPILGTSQPCVFPFVYDGETYNDCTTVVNNGELWCSTAAVHIPMATPYGSCVCTESAPAYVMGVRSKNLAGYSDWSAESECAAYAFNPGVGAGADDGCAHNIRLSSRTDPSCSLSCDAGYTRVDDGRIAGADALLTCPAAAADGDSATSPIACTEDRCTGFPVPPGVSGVASLGNPACTDGIVLLAITRPACGLQCSPGYAGGSGQLQCSLGRAAAGALPTATLTCTACAPGQYSSASGSSDCTRCVAGRASTAEAATTSTICQVCPVGQYQADSGQQTCDSCAAGKFRATRGATQPNQCTACVVGRFQADAGASGCDDCYAGYYGAVLPGATSHTQCAACAVGRYAAAAGSSSCTGCPGGRYSELDTQKSFDACLGCLAGQYQTSSGATSCISCAAGLFSTIVQSISASCSSCPAGQYQEALGKTSCIGCPVGSSSIEVGSTSNSQCAQCAAGKFQDSAGASSCASCARGTFSSVGQQRCEAVDCPAFSSGNLADSCACDVEYTGTIVATAAPPYYSGVCTLSAGSGQTIVAVLITGLVFCVLLGVLEFVAHTKWKANGFHGTASDFVRAQLHYTWEGMDQHELVPPPIVNQLSAPQQQQPPFEVERPPPPAATHSNGWSTLRRANTFGGVKHTPVLPPVIKAPPRPGHQPEPWVKRAFAECDKDGSGLVSKDEVSGVINALGIQVHESYIKGVFAFHDKSGDGLLDLYEFDDLCHVLKDQHRKLKNPVERIEPPPSAELKDLHEIEPFMYELFAKYDTGKTGSISKDESIMLLMDEGNLLNIDGTAAAEYIDRQWTHDSSKDGSLDIHEFDALVHQLRKLEAARALSKASRFANAFAITPTPGPASRPPNPLAAAAAAAHLAGPRVPPPDPRGPGPPPPAGGGGGGGGGGGDSVLANLQRHSSGISVRCAPPELVFGASSVVLLHPPAARPSARPSAAPPFYL